MTSRESFRSNEEALIQPSLLCALASERAGKNNLELLSCRILQPLHISRNFTERLYNSLPRTTSGGVGKGEVGTTAHFLGLGGGGRLSS